MYERALAVTETLGTFVSRIFFISALNYLAVHFRQLLQCIRESCPSVGSNATQSTG